MLRKIRNKLIALLLYYDLKAEIQQEPKQLKFVYYPCKSKKVGFNVEFYKWRII